MEIRWTYTKIADRAKSDAEFDDMFGGDSAFKGTMNSLKKLQDIENYEYNYNREKGKSEKRSVPRPARKYKGRGSRG